MRWLDVLMSQVKALHTTFLSWKSGIDQTLLHNGQVIYLTKLLNDKFDSIGRGIYIDTISDSLYTYLFNNAEGQPATYFYNNYSSTTTYSIDEYAQTPTGVYKATAISTNLYPDTNLSSWTFVEAPTYLFNQSEIVTQLDFIVYVPLALSIDPLDIQVVVNYYKIAGKHYSIQTY